MGHEGWYGCVPAFAWDLTARGHEAQQKTGRGTFVPQTFGAW